MQILGFEFDEPLDKDVVAAIVAELGKLPQPLTREAIIAAGTQLREQNTDHRWTAGYAMESVG